MTLPPYIDRKTVQDRLARIFPDGSPNRSDCVNEIAASTVFTMLYIGAVEGAGPLAAPKHVYRMGDEQAALASDSARIEYRIQAAKRNYVGQSRSWYAVNTRESIRDDTIRKGLILVGAATSRSDVAITADKPRYALAPDFAGLFDPKIAGTSLDAAIAAWRRSHLSAAALARIAVAQEGAIKNPSGVKVEFPNGETRTLSAGPSSIITRSVIEEFSRRFLAQPVVLWVSDSSKKVVARDELLAKRLKLNIDPSRNLPDVILVDTGHGKDDFLIVFVEVVATDGPITDDRRADLLRLATDAGFEERQVAFVTAFLDRDQAAFKKAFARLAWNSFAWLAGEPQRIIALLDVENAPETTLHDLLALRKQPK